jgi:hypothetical protein
MVGRLRDKSPGNRPIRFFEFSPTWGFLGELRGSRHKGRFLDSAGRNEDSASGRRRAAFQFSGRSP